MVKKVIICLTLFVGISYSQKWDNKYLFNEVDDYVKLTKETLHVLVDKMHYPVKDKSLYNYDLIFQKSPFDTLLSPPYIRVEINERGRLAKSALLDLGAKSYKYDSKTSYLWHEGKNQLNVIIPTNLGTINIYCNSTSENFENDKKSFVKFVNSVILYENVKYSYGVFTDKSIAINLIKYFMLFFSVAIIFMIFYLRYKKLDKQVG